MVTAYEAYRQLSDSPCKCCAWCALAHASEAGSRWDVASRLQRCIGDVNPLVESTPILGVLLFPGFPVFHPLTQTIASSSQVCHFSFFCLRYDLLFAWLLRDEIFTFKFPSHTLLGRSFVLRILACSPASRVANRNQALTRRTTAKAAKVANQHVSCCCYPALRPW